MTTERRAGLPARSQWRTSPIALVTAALLLGLLAGAAVALAPFYLAFAVLLALGAGLVVFRSPLAALVASFGVITLLPFGTVPVKIAFTPTLLELALLGLTASWLLRMLADPGHEEQSGGIRFSPLGGLVLLFLSLSFFSFLIGSGGAPDSLTLHNYIKLVLGVLFCFSVVNVVRHERAAATVLRWLVLSGFAAALVGIGLYALPDPTALAILRALGRVGYPTAGRILRYVGDDPSGVERAIGTSVDPNAFGGLLAMVAAIAVSQAFSKNPVLPRRLLWAAVGCMGLALFLTQSRAALGGLVVAALFLATVRFRRLWWVFVGLGIAAAILIGVLGKGEAFVERVESGVRFEDQANVMRLNEYRNALRIIQAYPVFGVGFGSAPQIDLTTGVSSIYLTIAERMGLVGLAVFLISMGVFFTITWRAVAFARGSSAGEWLIGVQAAVLAALAVGLLDHYYFNIEFSHMVALFWGTIGYGLALRQIILDGNTEQQEPAL